MGHGLWVHGQLLLAREGDHGVELQPDVGTDLHAHPQPQTSVGGGEASGRGDTGSWWAVLAPSKVASTVPGPGLVCPEPSAGGV